MLLLLNGNWNCAVTGAGGGAGACLVLCGHWPSALLAGKCATIDNRNSNRRQTMMPQIAVAVAAKNYADKGTDGG